MHTRDKVSPSATARIALICEKLYCPFKAFQRASGTFSGCPFLPLDIDTWAEELLLEEEDILALLMPILPV